MTDWLTPYDDEAGTYNLAPNGDISLYALGVALVQAVRWLLMCYDVRYTTPVQLSSMYLYDVKFFQCEAEEEEVTPPLPFEYNEKMPCTPVQEVTLFFRFTISAHLYV